MDKDPGGSVLMQLLNHLADLMIVSILWLVCSIPVFTIGASTTAMYTVTMKLTKGENVSVGKSFFQAFSANFKKATKLWLILLIPTALIVLSVFLTLTTLTEVMVVRIICLVMAAVMWLACSFVYPLTAFFENTIRRTLLNALLMVFGDLFKAVWIGILGAIPFALYMVVPRFFLQTIVFWPIAGIGIIADLQSRAFLKVFTRYLPDNAVSQQSEQQILE